MSITTRLLEQRYGPMNTRLLTVDQIRDIGIKNHATKNYYRRPEYIILKATLLDLLKRPPKKGRYFKEYIKTINEFERYLNRSELQTRVISNMVNTIVNHVSVLLYRPEIYTDMNNLSYPLINNLLFHMRGYIIDERTKLDLNPIIKDKSKSTTAMYYPFPKPLHQSVTPLLGSILFNKAYNLSLITLNHNNLKPKIII